MNTYRSPTDLTMKQQAGGGGMSLRLSYTRCGHKGARLGGLFRNGVPWLCASCNAAKKAAA